MSKPESRVGTAGWSIPANCQTGFAGDGSLLQRYAGRLNAAEINSSFYRPHRRATYERWAASVPDHFRFSVKAPKLATHERRLTGCEDILDRFTGEIAGLGDKLSIVLVQLPPSLRCDTETAGKFFSLLRVRTTATIVCEPRHESWFAEDGDALLASLNVVRAAADPARTTDADKPGGWDGLAYYRLHGSPRMYWSYYGADFLADMARRLNVHAAAGTPAWCIFDNTGSGAALPNALAVMAVQRSCIFDPAA